MQSQQLLSQLRKMADEVTAREGCTVYDLEFVGSGPSRILRIYIDKAGSEENVSIEDCSNVSRGMNLLLDAEDVIPGGEYNLEVSSPGVERPLRERWHYEKVLGKTISLKTFAPLVDFNPERPDLGKARTIAGPLSGVEERGVKVRAGESDVFIPFESITKAYLVFDFGGAQNGGPQGKNQHGKKPKGKSRR